MIISCTFTYIFYLNEIDFLNKFICNIIVTNRLFLDYFSVDSNDGSNKILRSYLHQRYLSF